MAVSDTVVSIFTLRHTQEQRAYEEIRNFLSGQFVLDPVLFMQQHGRRPEDLDGAYLRGIYLQALSEGMQVKQPTPLGFTEAFHSGKFFKSLEFELAGVVAQ